MRLLFLAFLTAVSITAAPPILYTHGVSNAASYVPFGLPNAGIARGSIFTIFGENLGPQQTPPLAFPLSPTLGGVSISVTQAGTVTQCFPVYVSGNQVNAVMPSSVTAGLATLRLTYQSVKSNAVTILIADSSPGIFAISSGGYGPSVVQNFVPGDSLPINSLTIPAARGQVVIIWGTGLGPVTFPDNVAPTAGNVATPVTVTIGGQSAGVLYAGRSPCCSGVDQIAVTIPDTAPLGCWVPVVVNAGGTVSNVTTIAIAAPGAASCDDAGNPVSALVRTGGSQAFIHLERVDSVEDLYTVNPGIRTVDNVYSRFYNRQASPYAFDPYMSYPPAGSCTVLEAVGDSFNSKSLPGTVPASASLSPQPTQTYHNGTQPLSFNTFDPFFSSSVGGTVSGTPFGVNLLGDGGTYIIDPRGPNKMTLPIKTEPPPGWTRPNDVLTVPRNAPLNLTFSPGDMASSTGIVIYAYSAVNNSTVEVECVAPAGAKAFTVPADSLANLPPTYQIYDGSYANLFVGTLGLNNALPFTNGLAASGILMHSNWTAQSVVLQ